MNHDELQALLSGHAAGTLSDAERAKLMDLALNDQAVFDQLAEEEPLRAALETVEGRALLLDALEQNEFLEVQEESQTFKMLAPAPMAMAAGAALPPQPPPVNNRLLWVALGCCVIVGGVTLSLWKKPIAEQPKQMAVIERPQEQPKQMAVNREAPPQVKQVEKAKRVALASPQQDKERAKAEDVDIPRAAAAPPPAAPAVADSIDVRAEAKTAQDVQANAVGRVEEIKKSIVAESRRDAAPERMRAAQSNAIASGLTAAKPVASPQVIIQNRRLVIRSMTGGFAYAFFVQDGVYRPLIDAAANALQASVLRDFLIPAYAPGAEVWVLIAPLRDPALDGIAAGSISLPERSWIKLKLN